MFEGESDNRIFFMTDMLVNAGTKDGDTLYDVTKNLVEKKIYTTFIGNVTWKYIF
jgi:hypothetical protein